MRRPHPSQSVIEPILLIGIWSAEGMKASSVSAFQTFRTHGRIDRKSLIETFLASAAAVH
jgi:hypothetical protein